MSSPIINLESEEQAYSLLKEWQERLFLLDWIIKVKINCSPEDFVLKDVDGEVTYSIEGKCCVIKILDPKYYGDRIVKYCAEVVLIHELLHCKYNWVERDYASIEVAYYDTLEHSLLEQMAKSLLMTKYNLTLDWFRNFESPSLQQPTV